MDFQYLQNYFNVLDDPEVLAFFSEFKIKPDKLKKISEEMGEGENDLIFTNTKIPEKHLEESFDIILQYSQNGIYFKTIDIRVYNANQNFLAAKEETNFFEFTTKYSWYPLFYAIEKEDDKLFFLIISSYNLTKIDVMDDRGVTALVVALRLGKTKYIKYLLPYFGTIKLSNQFDKQHLMNWFNMKFYKSQ